MPDIVDTIQNSLAPMMSTLSGLVDKGVALSGGTLFPSILVLLEVSRLA